MSATGDILDNTPAITEKARPFLSSSGYQPLRRTVVFATTFVALVPLVIMSVINYIQYERTLQAEAVQNIGRLLANTQQSIEFFLGERRSALGFLIRERKFSELCDSKVLGQIIRNMNDAFSLGKFVDLGIIDSWGEQLCYQGPHDLQGDIYSDEKWFHQVIQGGIFTSDVFLGHRNSPHFAIAMRHRRDDYDDDYILRAAFDAKMLSRQIHTAGLSLHEDIFLINQDGVLQTPSRRYGKVLEKIPFDVPHNSSEVAVHQQEDERGQAIFLGYAKITNSPFMLMFVKSSRRVAGGWQVSVQLFGFLAVSAMLVLAVILWGSEQFVRRIQTENLWRATLMHKVEYNNRLASIGRLAAGVAHEINNPLAIINEKTGLIKDLVLLHKEFPRREKFLDLVDSVLGSVERCKTITHRLLGFAKHMDVRREVIDVHALLKEVLGFLDKEAEYRNIHLTVDTYEDVPTIESDRGQLQQVFLNLLNNAVGAVKDGGHIDIVISQPKDEDKWLCISVSDDGIGIPKEHLPRIFEPFFTTKEKSGTGLGLSITYGIVQKLGGKISVTSELNRGTCFTVFLPVKGEE